MEVGVLKSLKDCVIVRIKSFGTALHQIYVDKQKEEEPRVKGANSTPKPCSASEASCWLNLPTV